MKIETLRAEWRKMRGESPIVQQVLSELRKQQPKAFDQLRDGARTTEQVALSAAHAEGFRECLRFLHTLGDEASPGLESGFEDMTEQ